MKGSKIWFVISRVRYIWGSYTERIRMEFVRQNQREQTFSSLYREVWFTRGSLYRYYTVDNTKIYVCEKNVSNFCTVFCNLRLNFKVFLHINKLPM